MLHARVMRPPAVGARLSVSTRAPSVTCRRRASCASRLPRRRRRGRVDCARRPRAEAVEDEAALPARRGSADWARGPVRRARSAGLAGKPCDLVPAAPRRSPPPTSGRSRHTARSARRAPSPTSGPTAPRIWTASQGTHRFRNTFAPLLRSAAREGAPHLPRRRGLLRHERPRGRRRRCGHPVADSWAAGPGAMDAARRTRPEPKGPPQLLDLAGVVDGNGRVLDWRTEMWLPEAAKGLPTFRCWRRCGLAWSAAGAFDRARFAEWRSALCGRQLEVVVHWLKDAPLRPPTSAHPARSPTRSRSRASRTPPWSARPAGQRRMRC